MFILFLWHLAIAAVATRNDAPIVIERPLNRVEFDDLLMEYNHEQGPTPNVTVNVSVTLNSARLSDDILRASLILEQSWNDMRLLFKGVSEVALPNNVHVWQPDTVVLNALHSESRMTSSFLNYDGTIRKRQLLVVELPCEESVLDTQQYLECPLELTSLSNRGVELIDYSVEDVELVRTPRISNTTTTYELRQDRHTRFYHTVSVVLYLKKPHILLGDLIERLSKVAHPPDGVVG